MTDSMVRIIELRRIFGSHVLSKCNAFIVVNNSATWWSTTYLFVTGDEEELCCTSGYPFFQNFHADIGLRTPKLKFSITFTDDSIDNAFGLLGRIASDASVAPRTANGLATARVNPMTSRTKQSD